MGGIGLRGCRRARGPLRERRTRGEQPYHCDDEVDRGPWIPHVWRGGKRTLLAVHAGSSARAVLPEVSGLLAAAVKRGKRAIVFSSAPLSAGGAMGCPRPGSLRFMDPSAMSETSRPVAPISI